MSVDVRSPLGEVLGRLAAVDSHTTYRLGVPAEGWQLLSDLDGEALARWYEKSLQRGGDRRAAAADVAGGLAYTAVMVWVLPLVAGRRLPLHRLDQVAVHLGEQHPDGVAYAEGTVAMLPSDPMVDAPGVEAATSWGELLDRAVDRLDQVGVLFDRLRSVVRIGEPALWGEVADMTGALALWAARELDTDRHAAWADAQALIDRLAARRERLKARPKLFPVAYSGGEEMYQVRGTCCLYYRTCADPDPEGEGYCATCPFRTDESRSQRLRRHLEEH